MEREIDRISKRQRGAGALADEREKGNARVESVCAGEDQGKREGRGGGERDCIAVHPCVNVTVLALLPPSLHPLPYSGSSPLLLDGITCSVVGALCCTVESRVSRLGALLQGLGGAPGASSRFLPGFVSTAGESQGSERRERRGSTRSRMPVMRGLIAPQNTFLDTIATRFDGTRECRTFVICE